ncbi:tail protein X [Methylosinus sp. PW1]|uniref:tail protein X n=1 Tax=Methylosinus sp. PW1 TaxID=107636 RepID=UPI0006925F7E|nr:tail protein X [Methylosinus sp. PW1]
MTIDVLIVETERTTLDLLLWRYYRREVAGLVEDTLVRNPGLSALGAILPVGTAVSVLRPAAASAAATAAEVVSLYD